jgi:hypothetical protein
MALDLGKSAPQIAAMAASLRAKGGERQKRLAAAAGLLRNPLMSVNSETLQKRIRAALPPRRKITWGMAALPDGERLDAVYRAPAPVAEYAAIATDGSQIEPDRHGEARYFLLNTGGIALRYGPKPEAEIFSQPKLFAKPEEMVIADPEEPFKQQQIDEALLGELRMVMEAEALAERVAKTDPALPVLALLDGTLIRFVYSGSRYDDFVKQRLLENGLLTAFDRLSEMSTSRRVAFASYISKPGSHEVVNLLRAAACPHQGVEEAGCAVICGKGGPGKQECDGIAKGLTDGDLFAELLEPGERSALFPTQAPIVQSYGRHAIWFCYVNAGDEIARLEMPVWVARDTAAVDFLHGAILDQCKKGRGYPLALQEAHEAAVVTLGDRQNFQRVLDAALTAHGMGRGTSAKARSKRERAV